MAEGASNTPSAELAEPGSVDYIMSILENDDSKDAPADTPGDNPDEGTADGTGEEGAAEGAEDGADAADDEPAGDEPPGKDAEPSYTVTVDGKEVTVPLSELTKGYSRQADYSRKTAELAERTAAEAGKHKAQTEAIAREVDQLAQLAHLIVATDPLLAEAAKTDWATLAETDAEEYTRRKARVEARREAIGAVEAEQQRRQQAAMGDRLTSEASALKAAIPDFADATKAKALREDIRGHLSELGFTSAELGSIVDHRFLVLAHSSLQAKKAAQARAAAAAKKTPPAPTKTVKPNSQGRSSGRSTFSRNQLAGMSISQRADALASLL